jgi:MFS transporter, ACS family, solute carrier family 17 (sodium-dependent inorganic phosphate cotransporter), other
VLSSFFVGYLLLQVAGGLLADRFGGKAVLGAGVLLWSLFTVLTPPAAYLGLTALIITRVLMGMGEAVTFPSIYTLYSRWVPLAERARAVALANSGIPWAPCSRCWSPRSSSPISAGSGRSTCSARWACCGTRPGTSP